jgi:hypothetical protein
MAGKSKNYVSLMRYSEQQNNDEGQHAQTNSASATKPKEMIDSITTFNYVSQA